MTELYLRQVSLIVGDADGAGLELSEFSLNFEVKQNDLQSPNTLYARVFNLSEQTANKIQKEFTKVVLRAGYEGAFGVIFSGTVTYVRRGRMNGTDTFLDIYGSDGDKAYNWSVVNKTLAAGSTPKTRVEALLDSLRADQVTPGNVPEFEERQFPRGVVLFGATKDALRTETESLSASWSIQNGRCEIVPLDSYIPGEAIVLNAQTGLVGMPERSENGISLRCLINPNIKVGGRIQLDNSTIQGYNFDQRYVTLSNVNADVFSKTDDKGFYKVLVINHVGTTRANDYYSDIICVALDVSVPIGLAARGVTGS